MPVVLVTGATAMQNSPFSSPAQDVAIASTHYTYLWMDGLDKQAWVAGLNTKIVYL